MASTIEILLTSNFDDAGFTQAESRIQEIMEQVATAMSMQAVDGGLGADFMETMGLDESVAGINQITESATFAGEALRKFARDAANAGETEFAKKLNDMAKQADSYAQSIKTAGKLTQTEMIANLAKGEKTLDGIVAKLREAAKAEKQRAASMLLSGNAQQGQINTAMQAAKAYEQEANEIEQLSAATKNLSKIQKDFPLISEFFTGTETLKETKNIISSVKKEMEALAKSKTEPLDKRLNAQEVVSQLEKFDNTLTGSRKTLFKWGKDAEKISTILNSSFNQLGFALFVTTSSFRNLQMIGQAIVSVFEGAAEALDKINKAAFALDTSVKTISQSFDEIDAAGKGWVDATELAVDYGKAVRESGQDIDQELLPKIASIGRAMEATGIVDLANEAGKALLKGLGGDAAAVAEIFPNISRQVETAKKSAEILGQEFDETEYIISLVTAEIDRTAIATDNLTLKTDAIKQMKAEWGLLWDAVKIGLTVGLIDLGEAITGVEQTSKEFSVNLVAGMALLGHTIGTVLLPNLDLLRKDYINIQKLIIKAKDFAGKITTEEATQALQELDDEMEALDETIDTSLEDVVFGFTDSWFEAHAIASEALGLITDETEQMANDVRAATEDLLLFTPSTEQIGVVSDIRRALQEQLEFLQSDEYKLTQDIIELWEDFDEKINEINANMMEDIHDARQEALDDIYEMEQEAAEKRIDLAEDLADKLTDIDADLQVRIDRMIEDFNDKKEDSQKKSKKKLIDIEEDYQKKINDIQRKFELSRLSALIDRDARALFEAEQRRNQELQDAKETRDEKIQDEIEAEKEREQRERDNIERSIRRANEDAERKRQAARNQYKKDLEEVDEQLEEDIAKRNEARDKEIKAAEAAADKERKKLGESYNEREADLKKHYDERKRITDLQNAIEEAKLLEDFTGTERMWSTHYANLITFLETYRDQHATIIQQIIDNQNLFNDTIIEPPPLPPPPPPPPPPGGDGGAPPPDGGGGEPCADSATVNPKPNSGQQCFRPIHITYIAPDCSTWHCTFGQGWQPGPAPGVTGENSPATQTPVGFSTGGGQGGQQIAHITGAQVSLKTNDPGLDQYIQNTTFDIIVDLFA